MDIRRLVRDRRIKQLEIAKALGTTSSTVSLYLNGWKPLPERFHKRLSKFLGISLEEVASNHITSIKLK